MRIGASLILIALGAILKFAVSTNYVAGINLGTVGVILMIVGIIGLLITLVLLSTRRRTDIVHEPYPDADGRRVADRPGRTTYVEPSDYDRRI